MQNKGKDVYLIGGSEEGCGWTLTVLINAETTKFSGRFNFPIIDKLKKAFREKDRIWVALNIPSSIAWVTEIHHNWRDGGRMYLLSKKEHRLRDKQERGKNEMD